MTRPVGCAATIAGDDAAGFEIHLGGKPLRLGDGRSLKLPTRALAEAVRAEWDGGAPIGRVRPEEIGLTRLAATMIHRIAPARAAMVDELVAWGVDDLLRYRAPDAALNAEQAQQWDPVLDWLDDTHGLRLAVVTGIRPLGRSPAEIERWQAILGVRSDAALTALGTLVPALGSLVLALAVLDSQLDAGRAVRMSRLEAAHQAIRWGEDPAMGAARAARLAEVEEALRFTILAAK